MDLVGKTLLQNLGGVEKAIITVYQKNKVAVKVNDLVSTTGMMANAAAIKANSVAMETAQAAADAANKAAEAGSTAAKIAAGTAAAAAAAAGATNIKQMIDQIGEQNLPEVPSPASMAKGVPKEFQVQFNPSELSIYGSGGGFVRQQNFIEKEGSSIDFQPIRVNLTLSCKFIFDESDSVGDFSPLSWPGGVAGVSSLNPEIAALDAAKLAHSIMVGSKVRTEVTALLAAVRNEYCQRVGFTWGNMHYEGDVNNISAQYTMFNVSGEPVRAVVSFSMLLIQPSDTSTANDPAAAYLLEKPWNNAYKKMFSITGRTPVSRLSSAQNFLGSIMNLGL